MRLLTKIKYIIFTLIVLVDFIDPIKYDLRFEGMPMSFPQILMVIIAFILIAAKNIKYYKLKPIEVGFVFYFIGLFFASFLSDDIFINLVGCIGLFIRYASIFIIVKFLFKKRMVIPINLIFFMGFLYWSFYIYYIYLTQPDSIAFFKYAELTPELYNNGSTIYNKHYYSSILGACMFFTFALWQKNLLQKSISIVILVLTIYAMIIIQTRGGLLAMLGILLFFFTIRYKVKGFIIFMAFFLIIGNALYSYISKDENLAKRFALDPEIQTETSEERVTLYQTFISDGSSLIFGQGIKDPYLIRSDGVKRLVHNQYLSFIISAGTFALILVFLLLKSAFRIIINSTKAINPTPYSYAILFILVFLIFTDLTNSFVMLIYAILNEETATGKYKDESRVLLSHTRA